MSYDRMGAAVAALPLAIFLVGLFVGMAFGIVATKGYEYLGDHYSVKLEKKDDK